MQTRSFLFYQNPSITNAFHGPVSLTFYDVFHSYVRVSENLNIYSSARYTYTETLKTVKTNEFVRACRFQGHNRQTHFAT